MSNKHETDTYHVRFFDAYGTEIKERMQYGIGNYMTALGRGKDGADRGRGENFAVSRVLYNSVDELFK